MSCVWVWVAEERDMVEKFVVFSERKNTELERERESRERII